MIVNSRSETMRHIPEDELHAYLDQALSRSQCVEIESHLAACASCRAERDGIAGLRDRTTALLATLAPPRGFTPSVELLRERADVRAARIRERWRLAAWAASVVLAVGLGWAGKGLLERQVSAGRDLAGPPATAPVNSTSEPATELTPAPSTALVARAEDVSGIGGVRIADAGLGAAAPDSYPVRVVPAPSGSVAAAPLVPAAPRFEPVGTVLSSGEILRPDLNAAASGTFFRTVSWDNAQRERGASVPRIAGLPVMQVQVGGSGDGHGRPLVVVAQQLESGQVIRTIEGPATDVNKLLASQGSDSSSPWPTIDDSSAGIAGGDGAMTVRRGDRILAITAPLSSDSLRAMIRRLNVTER